MDVTVKWIDLHREPKCPSNPKYPNGMHIAARTEGPTCYVDLPYPFARCGYAVVKCNKCGYSVVITTAGRPDDARSIDLPCKGH